MSDDSHLLCDRAQSGDMTAASDLVARFYQPIFAYLRRLAGNEDEAADLTQKTFSRAWTSLGTFQRRSSFKTWLHGIAYHVYIDWRRKVRPGEAQSDEWWESRAAETPTPLEDAVERDLARQLYRWVDLLDDDKKQTVHLHYFQRLTIEETAEVLSVATSTVKYRLREALDFLRVKAAEPRVVPKGELHD